MLQLLVTIQEKDKELEKERHKRSNVTNVLVFKLEVENAGLKLYFILFLVVGSLASLPLVSDLLNAAGKVAGTAAPLSFAPVDGASSTVAHCSSGPCSRCLLLKKPIFLRRSLCCHAVLCSPHRSPLTTSPVLLSPPLVIVGLRWSSFRHGTIL
ncbi:hypothetical protein RJT34_29192 [Clitoria ternatea]|uniref:Uncharacterized protein n=1 Tax=Clitoria ternatea TaxID=43366 RepID=A0AAN9FE33_CLITE